MNTATWAWIGLIPLLGAYVIGYDVWANKTGHLSMSEQFHLWLAGQITGPISVGLIVGVFAALLWHFNINH